MGLFSKKEPSLEDMLQQMYEDPGTSQAFYTRLFGSDVFLPGDTESGVNGEQTLEGGEKLRILNLMGPDNVEFVPVFTSMKELASFVPEGTPCLRLNGHAVFAMTRGSVVVLNAASEYAVRLDPDYIAQVLDFFAAARDGAPGTTN